jgi:hypothetical protein
MDCGAKNGNVSTDDKIVMGKNSCTPTYINKIFFLSFFLSFFLPYFFLSFLQLTQDQDRRWLKLLGMYSKPKCLLMSFEMQYAERKY